MINILGRIEEYKKQFVCNKLADIHIIGYPKSGNTWVLFFLATYASKLLDREFDLDFSRKLFNPYKEIGPRLYLSHVGSLPGHQARLITELNLEPVLDKAMSEIGGKKVAFLTRDPRDVVVSLYFHSRKYRDEESMSEFIRDPKAGIENIIQYNNYWIKNKDNFLEFEVFAYEERRLNDIEEFRRLIKYIGWKLDESILTESVEVSDFSNMKKIEENNTVDHKTFKYGSSNDPDTMRVRKGKIAGYKEYFSENDIGYFNEIIDKYKYENSFKKY